MPLLGLDIGTQSLKAVVLSEDLVPLGSGRVAYPVNYPRPGWAEQDPQLWLAALRPAIGAALNQAGIGKADIKALAVCGQLDGCVPTSAAGEALGPAVIWMDRRAASALKDVDPRLVRDRCGLVLDATHMGAKIAWLASDGDTAGVAMWHQPVSFVVAALTGVAVMSHSLASTTMLYDTTGGGWSDELATLFRTTQDMLPRIAQESDIAGGLTEKGAEVTGLARGTPVAVGTGDDFSNLIGCGIGAPGCVGVSLGTAEAVGALSPTLIVDRDLLIETHAFPGGGYHLGNPGWLSGGAVRWASALLGTADDVAFTALAKDAPAGCDGLTFIPALTGAMSPRWIASARGSFLGLTPSHRPAHLARAVLEGTAFAMRDVIDRLDALGVGTKRLRLVGGGTRSELWCQIRADVAQRPVEALYGGDASAIGAGVIAAVAIGAAASVASASAGLRLDLRGFEPRGAAYEDAYARYRASFKALTPLWER